MQPEYECPVADYPRFYAEKASDRIAYSDGEQHRNYGELNKCASQVAQGLFAAGCKQGDRIGYLGNNSGPYVEVFFGACKAKAIYVGLNWRLTPLELEYILKDAGVVLVFCDPQFKEMLHKLQQTVPSLHTLISVERGNFSGWRDQYDASDPLFEHHLEETVVQFYTSGTTGKPKGVCLSNANMSEHRRSEDVLGDWYLRSEPQEVIINAMPNFHIGGLGWLLIGIYRGARVILMAAPDPDQFLDLIEHERVSHLFAVPVVLGMMLERQKQHPRDLSSLKVFHYGASPILPSMLREAIEVMACGFCQYYGMTETNGVVTVLSPDNHDLAHPARLKSVGAPIPGAQIKICDPEGNPLPANTNGEIWIKIPGVMKEYWNRPEATAEVLVDGWYKSGDGGRLDEAGFLYMGDRIKDMVVSGGENVYPSEVEQALCEHPAVAEVAVIGVPDKKWGETVKGCIVLAPGCSVTPDELILFLRERLAGYKIPRIYQLLDALPRTASGKLKKFELRNQMRRD